MLTPNAPAVITETESVVFGDLVDRALRMAALFTSLDSSKQSRVAIGASNSLDHLVALLGVLASGKIWVPINPRNGIAEIERGLTTTEPSIVVLDEATAARVPGMPAHRLLLTSAPGGASAQAAKLAPLAWPLHRADPSEIQAIKFTGGTSGPPKGVMQSRRSWSAMIASSIAGFGFDARDRLLVSTPITHGASTLLLPVLGCGGALVMTEAVKAPALADAIRRFGVTTAFMPPTQLTAFANHVAAEGLRPQTLRRLLYGAAPMRPERIREAQEILGPVLGCTYGQTEAPAVITLMTPDELSRAENVASVGRPALLTCVAIKGPTGQPAAAGELGEILVRGDLVMQGYWQQPKLTETTIIDGWLQTGDIGYLDERGYLFLKDRSKDVIITGGFNVYPSDVEAVLSLDPAVLHCAVFGMQDEKWGEAVHAAVELRPGTSFDPEATLRRVKNALGPVQTPKHLHVLDQLPRSSVGKILKKEIPSLLGAHIEVPAT
jgi:acyl-CoA synthetase (AMP-forming)/AMP-acid ligase II